MSDERERKQLSVTVDAEVHEMAKQQLDHGELSEIIRDVMQSIAYGAGWDERSLVDQRMRSVETELREHREDRRRAEAAIENKENELAELRKERDRAESRAEQFEGALLMFEKQFRRGEPAYIYPDHPQVRDMVSEYDTTAEELIELLRERNPDVPPAAFEEFDPTMNDRDKFYGLDEEQASLPVGERGAE